MCVKVIGNTQLQFFKDATKGPRIIAICVTDFNFFFFFSWKIFFFTWICELLLVPKIIIWHSVSESIFLCLQTIILDFQTILDYFTWGFLSLLPKAHFRFHWASFWRKSSLYGICGKVWSALQAPWRLKRSSQMNRMCKNSSKVWHQYHSVVKHFLWCFFFPSGVRWR